MEDYNYKVRREKEIEVCEYLNKTSCEEIENRIYKSIPIKEGLIMNFTLVYGYMLNKELRNMGLEPSKIVLDNLRPFRSNLYSITKENYKKKLLDINKIYKSAI